MCMAGNVIFKFLVGWLLDRVGIYRAAFFAQGAVLLSVFLFYKNYSESAFCSGGLFFGATYSIYMIILPQLLLHKFGQAYYKPLLSRITSINTLLGVLISIGIGRLIVSPGGVTLLWVIWAAVCFISLLLTLFLMNKNSSPK